MKAINEEEHSSLGTK